MVSNVYAFVNYSSTTIDGAGNGVDEGHDVCIDSGGNMYITGYVSNGVNRDIYLSKYTSSYVLVSSATFNGSGNGDDYGYSIMLDASNNIYVAGSIHNGTNSDIWIGKYNQSFVLQSSAVLNGIGNVGDIAKDLALYGTNIYVTGFVDNSGKEVWVAIYNSNLNIISSTTYKSAGGESQGNGIGIDGSGNVYIAGTVADNFGDIWVGKYNSSLVFQSSVTINGPDGNGDGANDIDVISSDIYVTGWTNDTTNNNDIWIFH